MREFDREACPKPRASEFPRAETFLKREGPMDLEIGCGVGWHPITYSQKNPYRNLVAIEHTRDKFERFQRRVERHGHPENLLPVHANAISWVAHCLPEESIDRVFLLYPNPERKNLNQRWHRMPFMGFLLSRIKKGGTLLLATNVEDYALDCHDGLLADWPEWNLAPLSTRGAHYKGSPRTHFEKKYQLRDEPLFEVEFQKRS